MSAASPQAALPCLTLTDLFRPNRADFSARATAAILAAGTLLPLQGLLLGELRYFPWQSFLASLGTKALELLQTRLPDILEGAWQKYQELEEYRDPAKHPPNETASVPLLERSFTSEHKPYLQVRFREHTYEVVFLVKLELVLKELTLEVQGGRIRAVQSGSLEGSGTISLGEVELAKKEFEPLPLPGRLALGDGIRL